MGGNGIDAAKMEKECAPKYLARVRLLFLALYLAIGIGMLVEGYLGINRGVTLVPGGWRGGYKIGLFIPSIAIPGLSFMSYGFILAVSSCIFLLDNRYFYVDHAKFTASAIDPGKSGAYRLLARTALWISDRSPNGALSGIILNILVTNFLATCVTLLLLGLIAPNVFTFALTIGVIVLAWFLWRRSIRKNESKEQRSATTLEPSDTVSGDRKNPDELEKWLRQEPDALPKAQSWPALEERPPERMEKTHWMLIFVSSVILVIVSPALFLLAMGAGVLLDHAFGNVIDLLHLFIFLVFTAIAFFISSLVFILGYFSSPLDIIQAGMFTHRRGYWMESESQREKDREFQERIVKSQWSYAVYTNLARDRRSRIAFCFTYLLPHMWMCGGFFLMIGILTLGVFGPILPPSIFTIGIGTVAWFGMTILLFIVGNRLMKKFVRDGIIKGDRPFPSPEGYGRW